MIRSGGETLADVKDPVAPKGRVVLWFPPGSIVSLDIEDALVRKGTIPVCVSSMRDLIGILENNAVDLLILEGESLTDLERTKAHKLIAEETKVLIIRGDAKDEHPNVARPITTLDLPFNDLDLSLVLSACGLR